MKQNYDFDIEKIKNLSQEEKVSRQNNLDLFYDSGFPSKQVEDWKFTDLNLILNKNFDNISNEVNFESSKEFKVIEKLKHRMKSLVIGDPLDKNTDVGAINSKEQLFGQINDLGYVSKKIDKSEDVFQVL